MKTIKKSKHRGNTMKKWGKKITVAACGIIAMTLSASQSFAAVDCTNATITSTGALGWDVTRSSSYLITAICNTPSTLWTGSRVFYIVSGNQEDSMYATALTALSSNTAVFLKLASAAENSIVTQINATSTSN
ncbi:MAG: hypothetical protein QTN59_07065 [Candidatus Electrothrix communis]|nr:MAG: hypothetical protein QTN59_07065 [Candidatus Electrothrix communis]